MNLDLQRTVRTPLGWSELYKRRAEQLAAADDDALQRDTAMVDEAMQQIKREYEWMESRERQRGR